MKTFKFFAYAFASLAMAFAVASCGDKEPQGPETPDTPVVKPADVVFSVKVKDVTLEKATITITHNGEKDYTWYGFCTTDVNTDLDEAIAAQIEYLKEGNVVFADVVRTGTINKDFVKDLQTNTVYRYIVFGLNEDTTTYGTPAYVDFTTDRVLAGFTATVARTTEESVKVNVVSKSGYDEDTWFAAICPASADVEEEFAAAVAAADLATALKAGDGNVTFDGLLPGTDYVVAAAGVKEDGTTYTDLITVSAKTTAVELALETVEVTDELVKIAVTSSSESEAATWFAVCYPKSEGPASVVFKSKVAAANLATALKAGDAVVTFNDVEAGKDYIVAVAGVTVTGKVYTAVVSEDVSTPAISFTLAVDETTDNSATVTVTSSSASQSATWFATIMPETTAVETAYAAAVAAADLSKDLKVGTQTLTFEGLTPGKRYTIAVAGVDAAGKIYTEVVSANVIPSALTLGMTVTDHGADYVTIAVTANSTTATWYAFCVAEDGVSTADEYAAAAVAAETDLASALRTGNATITFDNLAPAFYEVGVVGVNADGTIYTSALAESVKVIFTWNERTDWSYTFAGVAEDGTTLMNVSGVPAGQYYLPYIVPAEYLEGAEIDNILYALRDDLGFAAADLQTGNGEKPYEALEPGDYVAILAAADYQKVTLTGDYTTSTFTIEGAASPYDEWLGTWYYYGTGADGSVIVYTLELTAKEQGVSYNVSGYGANMFDVDLVFNYNAATKGLQIPAQFVGTFNDPDEGDYELYLYGLSIANSKYTQNDPIAIIAPAVDGEADVTAYTAGYSPNFLGVYSNSASFYGYVPELPCKMVREMSHSAGYDQWLGVWDIKDSKGTTAQFIVEEGIGDQYSLSYDFFYDMGVGVVPATYNPSTGGIALPTAGSLGEVNSGAYTMCFYGIIDYNGDESLVTGSYDTCSSQTAPSNGSATLEAGPDLELQGGGTFSLIGMSWYALKAADGKYYKFNGQSKFYFPISMTKASTASASVRKVSASTRTVSATPVKAVRQNCKVTCK